MEILHEDNSTTGKFYTNNHLAHIEYTHHKDNIISIDHTEVDKSLSGQGIGKILVISVVEWARANNLKIIPLCPYAKSVFEKSGVYTDVWYKS